IVKIRPDYLDRIALVELSPPVLWTCLLVSLGSGIFFGILPALRSSTPQVQQTLASASRSGASRERQSVRTALVVAEVALSTVLLICAGLVIRSLVALERQELGFDPRGIVYADLHFRSDRYPNEAARQTMIDRVLEAVRAMPEVSATGTAEGIPANSGVMMI